MNELVTSLLVVPLTALARWVTAHPWRTVIGLLSIAFLGGLITTLTLLGGVLVRFNLATQERNLLWSIAQWLTTHKRLAYLLCLLLVPFAPVVGAFCFLGLVFQSDTK